MSKKATAKTGRLVWIEPNKLDEISDTGTFDYEDYSICVDLEVRIPKRSACGNETDVITFHTNHETAKDRISFFTGTDGYLTTSFTDITAADPTSNKETLGVSSIDISYNSYFYPQVTIKFVDVRGSSLMYPQEDMFKNGSQGSFFKALFCFPYPQFILKVKGFYGKQVQYDLAVEDFKTSFNPETGNFECVVQFIGYMYGIYADLPMSYLIAAPYVDYSETNVGKDYWKQQIENGIFVYDNGHPIDTFLQLRLKVKNASLKLKKLLQNNVKSETKNDYTKETGILDNIDSALTQLFRGIAKDNNASYAYDTEHLLIYSTNTIKITTAHCNNWAILNERINYYLTTFINGVNIPYINDISYTTTNDILNKINEQAKKETVYFQSTDFNKTLSEKYPSLKEQIKVNYPSGTKVYYYKFKIYDIFNILINRQKQLITLLDDITKDLESETQSLYLTVLGFKPTIENVFRIIFAHMDTFMNLYYNVLDKIKIEKLGNKRSPLTLGLTEMNSDLVRNENFIPPYPLVTNKENNKNETMWPGDYPPAASMEELKLVERMFDCIKVIRNEVKNTDDVVLPSNDETEPQILSIPVGEGATYNIDTMVFNMLPVTFSDLCYFENPYDCFKDKTKISKNAIFSTLGYRFKDKMLLDSSGSFSVKTRGTIEAINFFKSVKTLNLSNANEAEVRNMLKNSNADEFIKYVKTDFTNNNDKDYYHSKELTGAIISNDFYPINYNDISTIKVDNEQFFPKCNYIFTKIDSNNVGFFWDVMIKSRNELTEDSERKDYTKFWDRCYRMNNTWNMTAYSEEKGVEHFKSSTYKSLIYGSHHEYYYGDDVSTQTKSIDSRFGFINGLFTNKDWGENIRIDFTNYRLSSGRGFEILKDDGYREDNYDAIDKYLKNKDAIPCYTIDPSLMGKVSLYGLEFFYMQNDNNETVTYNGSTYHAKDLGKGYMFLEACAPYGVYQFTNSDRIHILTKWTILLWGARLLRMSLEDKQDFLYVKDGSGYKKPSKNSPMRVKSTTVYYERYGESQDRKITVYIPGVSKNSSDYLTSNCFTNTDVFSEQDKTILINMFLDWITTSNTDGFKAINDVLEFKLKNNSSIGLDKFQEIMKFYVKHDGLDTLYTVDSFKKEYKQFIESSLITEKDIELMFKEGALSDGKKRIYKSDAFKLIFSEKDKNVYALGAIKKSNTGNYGLIVPINTKHVISQRLTKYKFDTYIVSPISPQKITSATFEKHCKDFYQNFITKLNDLYTKNNGYVNSILDDTSDNDEQATVTQIMLRNKDLKLSLYLTLKNLYDRWLCGMKRDRWNYQLYQNNKNDVDNICEFKNFFFIDSFYNDIGSKTIIDIGKLNELINSIITNRIGDDTYSTNGMKFQGVSIYQFMASILQKNSMLFMAVPCFNRFKDEESIRELFTPYSWFDRGEPIKTSYIGIYPHRVSGFLDIEGANGYEYPNDGFDIADVNGDFKDTIDIPDLTILEGGYVMPAFGVTYGKQDQSYFKKVTVNMDKPQATEYSIGATLDIANNYGENQKVQTFVGQDLYKVYSNHSYTCTVEMMGNAMITPLMYFQLNNIPMFRGAYMVIKVEHSISQGNMTTVFTGVRMSKNKIPFASPMLEIEGNGDDSLDNGNNNGGGGNTIIPNTPTSANEAINRFIEAARSAVIGKYGEEPPKSNYVPKPPELPIQGTKFEKGNPAWCAIFVAWCSEKAGLNNTIIGGKTDFNGGKVWYKGKNWTQPYTTFCESHYYYYSKLGRFIEKNAENKVNNPPQMGDLILFLNSEGNYESSGRKYGHIGIVESYNAETGDVTYIHGNNDTNVVARKTEKYDTKRIGGFARPPFEDTVTPNTGSNNNSNSTQPTTQPSADTSTQSSDTLILRTVDEKINFIKAIICQESGNKHSAVGDKGLKDGNAIGIMQIRPIAYREINRIRNKYKKQNYILGQPFPGTEGTEEERKALTRDDQVKGFISVMEHTNKIKDCYLKTGQDKKGDAIPWDFRKCCAVWNCGNKNKKCDDYFNHITTWYNKIKSNPSSFLSGDGNGWTPNAAFNSFFS